MSINNFFHPVNVGSGTKGVQSRKNGSIVTNDPTNSDGKPWKKHHNRNKKEKLRRLYRHLDA